MTIEGETYNLIYRAVEATKNMVEGVQKLGESGLESVKYPDETLHEIVTNAVLHPATVLLQRQDSYMRQQDWPRWRVPENYQVMPSQNP